MSLLKLKEEKILHDLKWLNKIVNCQGNPIEYKMILDDTDSLFLGVLFW